jgi:hypothetical protein
LRRRQVGHVEERDPEIDARERESGLELKGASKRVRRFFWLELFEQRYAEVVRAIRFFASVAFGSGLQQED